MIDPLGLGSSLFALKKYSRIIVDNDLNIVGGSCEVFGLSAQKSAICFVSLFGEAGQQQLQQCMAKLKQNDVVAIALPSVDVTPVEIIMVRFQGNIELIFCDASEAQQFLERQAIFYRYFLTTPVAICMTDAQGSILEVNPSFLRLYGYELQDVLGGNPRILKSGRHFPSLYQQMWQTISDPKLGHWTGEVINRASCGGEITVMLSISAVRKNSGELLGYIASAFDITQQKEMEHQLKKYNSELKELNFLKSELTAITSHDLKAPINSIISRINLMKDRLHTMTPDQIVTHLDKMVESGQKMGAFINQLLDMEKIESGQSQLTTQRLNLDALLYSTIELNRPTATDNAVTIRYEQDDSFVPIRADRMKLEQVFNNIISNAINYSPAGSCIDISCRSIGSMIRVEISDQGPGIPAEEIDGIFDRFSQVKKKGALSTRVHGSGLGLNIVKKYVEMHNGTVAVRNANSGGCIFSVELYGRGVVSSNADLAALIVDYNGNLYPRLEAALKGRGVCCYGCKTASEKERILKNECPELVFYRDDTASSAIVVTMQENPSGKVDNYRVLEMPVDDIEIHSLLTDAIIDINKVAQ